MKAIRVDQYGGPEVLTLREMPVPSPSRAEVLIKVKAAGVNPVDTYFRAGMNPAIKPPFTPGLDAAGVVESVGSGVTAFKQGDKVYTGSAKGSYAEFCLSDAQATFHLSDKLDFKQGAAIGINYGTAHRALFGRAKARAGETVMIHGASGGVGIAAVQLAAARGLMIIGTAGSEKGLELARAQGAHHVLDHRKENYPAEILKLTGNRGVDIILEMLANVNLGKDLPLLAMNGRVIIIGSRGKVEITPRDLMSRDADVRGMTLFNVKPGELQKIHAELQDGFAQGKLAPVVGREMPLSQAKDAHAQVMEPGAYGKIILLP